MKVLIIIQCHKLSFRLHLQSINGLYIVFPYKLNYTETCVQHTAISNIDIIGIFEF